MIPKILFATLIGLLTASAGEEGPELHVFLTTGSHMTTWAMLDGQIYEVLCQDQSMRTFGPILIYENKSLSSPIELNSLASLEEVARREIAALGENPSKESLRKRLGVILAAYTGERTDSLILSEQHRVPFLAELKEAVSAEEYRRLAPLFDPTKVELDEKHWVMSWSFLTNRQAIERRTFSGTFSPFSIRKLETEVLAPNGTIPVIRFNPWKE